MEFLQNEMGQMVNRASRDKIPINLTKEEIQLYIKRFGVIDKENKGYVSINDIRRGLKVGNLVVWNYPPGTEFPAQLEPVRWGYSSENICLARSSVQDN